jgi:hypothetical protein
LPYKLKRKKRIALLVALVGRRVIKIQWSGHCCVARRASPISGSRKFVRKV